MVSQLFEASSGCSRARHKCQFAARLIRMFSDSCRPLPSVAARSSDDHARPSLTSSTLYSLWDSLGSRAVYVAADSPTGGGHKTMVLVAGAVVLQHLGGQWWPASSLMDTAYQTVVSGP
jgi:hypothetical protein